MKKQKQQGFTIIELIVVVGIMGTIAALLVVNYNQHSGIRNLKIAQNELITNVRKVQSYILSSRNVVAGAVNSPPRYYGLYLVRNGTSYVVQGIDSESNMGWDLETVRLPQGIAISNIQVTPAGGGISNSPYIFIGYSAPYGRMYSLMKSDSCASTLVQATTDPACMLQLSDRQVIITLQDQKSLVTKTVTLFGVSGTVSGQ